MAADAQGSSWGCLFIVGLVALAALFSNPSLTMHREALRIELQQRLDREIAQQGFLSGTLLWLGKDALIDTIIDGASYDNYGLASVTKYEDKRLTVGIFAHVFVVAEDRSATAPSAGNRP